MTIRFKNNLNPLIAAAVLLTLASCAPSAKQSIDTAIYNQSVSSNPCAASSACTMAFGEAQLKMGQPGESENTEFCGELLKREDSDLAICEVDIRNEKFQKVIASCKAPLLERLAKISKMRNVGVDLQAGFTSGAELERAGIRKFSTQTQIRDTSHGYLAITGDVQPGQVVLTFDDGPEPTNTITVLNTLNDFGAKAHFFQLGMRVQSNPKLTQRVAAAGHSIGNHSWDHPNFRKISFEEGLKQIKETHSLLHSLLGAVDPFFRFPFGNSTAVLDQVLFQNEMADFKWAIDSNDWRMVNADKSIRTNLQVIEDTMSQLSRHGRGIILMHDIHRRTAELLPELLRRISARGYSTVVLQPKDVTLRTNPPILGSERLP